MEVSTEHESIETHESMATPEQPELPRLRPRRTSSGPDVMRIDHIVGHSDDAASRLRALAAQVVDQNELEETIGRQADQALTDRANERDQKRLEKTQSDRSKLRAEIHKLDSKLGQRNITSRVAANDRSKRATLAKEVKKLDKDIEEIQQRIDERQNQLDTAIQNGTKRNQRMPYESEKDFLIRTGKITPFMQLPGKANRRGQTLQDALLDAEEEESEDGLCESTTVTEKPLSYRNLHQPGFADDNLSDAASEEQDLSPRPTKRRRVSIRLNMGAPPDKDLDSVPDDQPAADDEIVRDSRRSSINSQDAAFVPEMDHEHTTIDDSESRSDSSTDDDVFALDLPAPKPQKGTKKKNKKNARKERDHKEDLTGIDDGNETLYQARLHSWVTRRSKARQKAKTTASSVINDGDRSPGQNDRPVFRQPPTLLSSSFQDLSVRTESDDRSEGEGEAPEEIVEEEWHLPHPTVPDANFEDGYRIPGDIHPSLFDYQRTGVRWLWELYSQQAGGIIGDEMGLGKTIQAIAFLAGLHYSNKITKPIIIVAPATVMKQWVMEFHKWWPAFRVSILHTSGSGMIDVGKESKREAELSAQIYNVQRKKALTKAQKAAKSIVDRVVEHGHILVTTYSGLQSYAELLIPIEWEYAILDEGHKIRNPNTAITLYCKELRTANRIILSGTPMQNNLVELWSLFDFVFPMRLGTLVNFKQQFEFPIRQGGYANASNLQVQTAIKCAETLKDTISPYLLQRFKVDVAADLPKKTEQVLFCKLTRLQREAYESFLSSDDMRSILTGRKNVLYGVDILRKICNHPDLTEHTTLSKKPGYNYGSGVKSGKMVVVKELLDIWRKGGHKTLLFAQHRIMLDILEKNIQSMEGINYRRMDGNTHIALRQAMVDEFNANPDAHVFLLTTKVGGLGINLTGANRVIIFDPDWNPSTDIQARERAWRLGQKREVQIYRLMTAGTIEEKIFHRQIFKQFLTNKILKDPKQRQAFQLKDLHDLFSLGNSDEEATETGRLFQGTETRFYSKHSESSKPASNPTPKTAEEPQSTTITHEKVTQPRPLRQPRGEKSIWSWRRDPIPWGGATPPRGIAPASRGVLAWKRDPTPWGGASPPRGVPSSLCAQDTFDPQENAAPPSPALDSDDEHIALRSVASSREVTPALVSEANSTPWRIASPQKPISPSPTNADDSKQSPAASLEEEEEEADEEDNIWDFEGIASIEQFGEGDEGNTAVDLPTDGTNSEARILEAIFARSGVHSALEHDEIINGRKVLTADPQMIEKEAKRVATEAANELRRAHELARNVPVGTPTWTGRFGTAGRPDSLVPTHVIAHSSPTPRSGVGRGTGRGGPASSSILAGLQQRQIGNEMSRASSPHPGAPRFKASKLHGKQLLEKIRRYLVAHGGRVVTQMLVNHFSRHCTDTTATAEFKAMLRQIATLKKGGQGRGVWTLMDAFKEQAPELATSRASSIATNGEG